MLVSERVESMVVLCGISNIKVVICIRVLWNLNICKKIISIYYVFIVLFVFFWIYKKSYIGYETELNSRIKSYLCVKKLYS